MSGSDGYTFQKDRYNIVDISLYTMLEQLIGL